MAKMNLDSIPAHIEAGTLEYWKYRARQWQGRCQRSEATMTSVISQLNEVKQSLADLERRSGMTARNARQRMDAAERRQSHAAISLGDISGSRSAAPRGL